MYRRWLLLSGTLLLSGCLYGVRDKTDNLVCEFATHPLDRAPAEQNTSLINAPEKPAPMKAAEAPDRVKSPASVETDIQTTAYMSAPPEPVKQADGVSILKVPSSVPGADTPLLEKFPDNEAAKSEAVRKLYPALPALPTEPTPLAGPDGQPFTLSQFQKIAIENSPTLKQATSDVEAAKGNLIQARAYPNPTVNYQVQPSNDGSVGGVHGIGIDQTIKTAGKLKLASAAAQKDLDNAELALRRARSDLATQVRNAYFALIVSKEALRVNRGLAQLTDEVYRLQEELVEKSIFAASYEPAALRAQAYTVRLAYKQALSTYLYNWKQLVAVVGLRQLPLSEVAGRVDLSLPYYDFDTVLAHVLRHHTDVLTARNTIEKNQFNLKLAQVTPIGDIDFQFAVLKEFALAPEKYVQTVQIGMPIPLWDRNRGGIISAEAALVRALEEPHRVEINLTNNLANAYTNYKNNLDALEYYRKLILPDQIRTYRGVLARRQIDTSVAFADLVTAQQTLTANVNSYVAVLGQLWTSVVSVADFMQTDDLFQLAQPKEIPTLPDLESLPPLPCGHACSAATGMTTQPIPSATAPATKPGEALTIPDPNKLPTPRIVPLGSLKN